MQIRSKPMGPYATNCYIVSINQKDFIIDPGMGATDWVIQNVINPVAILNTHGHFDHIWSNAELKEKFQVPIYINKEDAFLLQESQFGMSFPKSSADVTIEGDQELLIEGIKIKFLHFPGHTPGCSVIEIGDRWFSGDFIFKGSIGRVDFPYSDPKAMKESLLKFQQIDEDRVVLPGHGEPTTIKDEQRYVHYWIERL